MQQLSRKQKFLNPHQNHVHYNKYFKSQDEYPDGSGTEGLDIDVQDSQLFNIKDLSPERNGQDRNDAGSDISNYSGEAHHHISCVSRPGS